MCSDSVGISAIYRLLRSGLLPLLVLLTAAGELAATTVTAEIKSGTSAAIIAESYSAKGKTIHLSLEFAPNPGTDLTVIRNTGLPFIKGAFSNLPQGGEVLLDFNRVTYRFIANYFGGSGNDLELLWPRQGVASWGDNASGQLGIASKTNSTIPVDVDVSGVLAGKSIISMAGGGSHFVAVCSDGTLVAWGDNRYGQLGIGRKPSSQIPVRVATRGALKGKRVIRVSAGEFHSLALCSDGTVFAWGSNSKGQLGSSKLSQSLVPKEVDIAGILAGKSVVSISAGGSHNLALCSDGSLVSWGANRGGQLGIGTRNDEMQPVLVNSTGVLAGKNLVSISAGADFSLALCSDGSVAAWGANDLGQLGDRSFTRQMDPVLVRLTKAQLKKKVVSISAGNSHSLALCRNGTVLSWGSNTHGQLGNGTRENRNRPGSVSHAGILHGKKIADVSAGGNHSLARCTDGNIVAWGRGKSGELGNNSTTQSRTAVLVRRSGFIEKGKISLLAAGLHSGWVVGTIPPEAKLESLVVGGATVSPAFSPDITSYLIRANAETASISLTPTVKEATSVSVNGMGVKSGSTVSGLSLHNGINVISIHVSVSGGSVRDYQITVNRTPTIDVAFTSAAEMPISGDLIDIDGLTANLSLRFAPVTGTELMLVRKEGLETSPARFKNLSQGQRLELEFGGVIYKFIVNYFGGTGNDLVLEWAYRDLHSWGNNDASGLGYPTYTSYLPVPTAIGNLGALSGRTIIKLAAGYALCSDGTVVSWGDNWGGRLGINVDYGAYGPVAVLTDGVLAGKFVMDISAGGSFALALCSDGTMSTWGYNGSGMLGNNSIEPDIPLPVAVDTSGILSDRKVVSIAAGTQHCLALCSDGTLVAWGDNSNGQLGDGTTELRRVPVEVRRVGALAGKTVVAIQGGHTHSIALCSDGSVVAWGGNAMGQLGNGTFKDSSIPVKVSVSGILAGKRVEAISSKGDCNLALTSGGIPAAWGDNQGGQLGDGSMINRNSPVRVGFSGPLSGKRIRMMAADYNQSLALFTDGSLATWGSYYDQIALTPLAVSPLGSLAGKPGRLAAAGRGSNFVLAATPLSNDSTLSTLTMNGATTDFGISPKRRNYAFCVPVGTSEVKFTPVLSHALAKQTVNGVALASATESPSIPLTAGGTIVTVKVTAEDGTSSTYILTVFTAESINTTYTSASFVPATYRSLDATGLTVNLSLDFEPVLGADLTVVNNTGRNFIHGQFENLAQGQELAFVYDGNSYRYVVDYFGGTGNDLVLHWLRIGTTTWGANYSGQFGNGTTTSSSVPLDIPATGILAGKTIVAISSGESHCLALCSDGTLVAWGANGEGQLGNGTTTSSKIPVRVEQSGVLAGKSITSISAGRLYSLALCSDGTIAAWGQNYEGALGDGSGERRKVPVKVVDSGALSGKSVIAVAAGYDHSLALCSDGTVAAWGAGNNGQLGAGEVRDSQIPVLVNTTGVLAGKEIVAIAIGGDYQGSFSLGLCSDGSVASWGSNIYGQLGNESSFLGGADPVMVDTSGVLAGKKVVSISAGGEFALAVCSDGSVAAWGSNSLGQLGNNSTDQFALPVSVDTSGGLFGRKITSVSAGDSFSIAMCSDGSVASWGQNSSGQLGDNSTINRQSPVLLPTTGGLSGRIPRLVEAGGDQAVVISSILPTTELSGLTTLQGALSPVFTPETTTYHYIAAPGQSSVAIFPTALDAARISVGGNDIAPGTAAIVPIANGVNTTVVRVSAGGGFKDYKIQIFSGSVFDATFTSPTDIPWSESGTGFSGVSVNLSLNFAPSVGSNLMLVKKHGMDFINWRFTNLTQGQRVNLIYGGKSYHFAANYYGGSGNDLVLEWADRSIVAWGNDYTSTPAALADMGILTGKTVTGIAAGASHSLALCADGSIASWGSGAYGELGAGDVISSNKPIPINAGGRTVVAISAASSNNLAICSDGTLLAWGSNGWGQLGNGGIGSSSLVPTPVDPTGVLAGRSVVAVAVGGIHCLALCSDGRVAAWGNNASGQLGDGTTTNRNVPVLVSNTGVLAGKSVVAISAGFKHSLALCSDGTLVAWGNNSSRQLGAENPYAYQPSSSVPVRVIQTGVLAGKTIVALSQAAHSSSIVLCSDGTMVSWGLNDYGQLGHGGLPGPVPQAVTTSGILFGKSVSDVSSGGSSSMAVCTDGTVVTWGDNYYGQLGTNSSSQSGNPVRVFDNGVLTGKKPLFGAVAYHCLLVQAEPVGESMAAAFDHVASSQKADAADGASNLLEYVLHGDTATPSSLALPVPTSMGDKVTFSFNRLAASAADTIQVFQYSVDMIHWSEVNITAPTGAGVVIGPVNSDGDQAVSVAIPKGDSSHWFGRLKVCKP